MSASDSAMARLPARASANRPRRRRSVSTSELSRAPQNDWRIGDVPRPGRVGPAPTARSPGPSCGGLASAARRLARRCARAFDRGARFERLGQLDQPSPTRQRLENPGPVVTPDRSRPRRPGSKGASSLVRFSGSGQPGCHVLACDIRIVPPTKAVSQVRNGSCGSGIADISMFRRDVAHWCRSRVILARRRNHG